MKFHNIVPFTIKLYAFTAIFIVCFIVLFEFYNTRIHSIELTQMIRDTMNKSCRYFQQETYRGTVGEDNKIKTFGNSYNIKDLNGTVKVTGKFYGNLSDAKEIHTNLFLFGDEFGPDGGPEYARSYMSWLEESLIEKGFNETAFKQGSSFRTLKDMLSDTSETTGENSLGAETMLTPANLGFTYLDPCVLKRIFKWKLVNRLTANSATTYDYTRRSLLKTDDYGDYVQWYGFRIYYDTLTLDISPSSGNLKLYDINDPNDFEELQKWTGIDLDTYRWGGDNEAGINISAGNNISDDDIRRYKILYDLRWTMKISYEGILPIKQVMTLFAGNESSSLVLSDDGKPFLSNLFNPLDIARRRSDVKTTMNSDGVNIQGNETFFDSPVTFGNDETKGGKLGNFEDANYRYEHENRHLGVGGGEGVIGLGQRLKYVVIY